MTQTTSELSGSDLIAWARKTLENKPVGSLYTGRVEMAADIVAAYEFGRSAAPTSSGEEFLEFKEALSDLRSLRQEHRDLNGGGPDWSTRNAAAWARVDELFANEDEAAWERQQEDAHG